MPANGGTAEPVIKVNEGEVAGSPQPLPGGEWVLFTLRPAGVTDWNQGQIVVQSLATGERVAVIDGGRDARYLGTGHLVYALDGVLYAVPFDLNARQVTGGAVSVIDGVGDAGRVTAAAHFGVAANGSLVYTKVAGGGAGSQTFVWVDRAGRETLVPARPRPHQEFNLSPDGTRIAVRVHDREPDIWIYDLERKTETRLTFDPDIEVFPTWTPDGCRVAFGGLGVPLSWRAADGTGTVEVLAESREEPNRVPQAFTPDARVLLFASGTGVTRTRLSRLALDGSRTVTPLPQLLPRDSASNQTNAVLSPDGLWLAYESDESGTAEVYVRPFPDVNGGRWQILSGGGRWPLWNPARGRTELFYLGAKRLMATAVTTTPVFTPGATMFLFQTAGYTAAAAGNVRSNRRYAVAPGGQRFLFVKPASAPAADDVSPQLLFVENWFEELKQRVPN